MVLDTLYASQTHFGFSNIGLEMHIFRVMAKRNLKFWFGSPCIHFQIHLSKTLEILDSFLSCQKASFFISSLSSLHQSALEGLYNPLIVWIYHQQFGIRESRVKIPFDIEKWWSFSPQKTFHCCPDKNFFFFSLHDLPHFWGTC